MLQSFKNVKKVSGQLSLPGDKSISHRALIFSALAKGESIIKNLPSSDDINSTINCLKNLGIDIIDDNENIIIVKGAGFKGFSKPEQPLNAGNSGTTARLLSGILAAQHFESTLIGDSSLSTRPMKRIIEPLTLMGADIRHTKNFSLPLKFIPSLKLKPVKYVIPISSAQVKGAIILAGLHFDNTTTVIQKSITRDHTERMLGLKVEKKEAENITFVSGNDYPVSKKYFIPGDISTAAYFIVLTLISKNSSLILKNISLNPTRLVFIEVLSQMGADIKYEISQTSNNEPYGDIIVSSSQLSNILIKKEIVPGIIDEIPILAIAGIFAKGDFVLRHAEELRIKESDRIKSICLNLSLLGLDIDEFSDGFKVSGEVKNKNPIFKSFGDHRITMAFSILSSLLESGGTVDGFNCVSVSNPDFLNQIYSITD
jgi:3-phosphoshikimate 1-carboxyvinyltransferase